MKKVTVLLALLMLFALATVASAQAPQTYDTGIQIANLSSTDSANIVVTFYELETATEAATATLDPVSAGSSVTLFPLGNAPASLPAGFDGSAVVSSDQPIAAIVNVLGDGFDFGSSYSSFDAGSQTVSLPLIAKNQVNTYNTVISVQNTGSTPADITVSYAGTACTENYNDLPTGAATRFDQSTNSCLPNGFVGAATVTAGADQTIVATVIETSNNNTGLFAYNGFTGGSTGLVAPLVQFNNGPFTSGFQIQNVGNSASNITVQFTPAGGNGTACTEQVNIPAGQSRTFGLGAIGGTGSAGTNNCNTGELFVGGAAVSANSSNQPLVGIVNQTNFSNFGSAYNAFDPAAATNEISMPLIMDRNGGFYTGFNIANVGTGSTTVNCTFSTSGNGATIPNQSQNLAAGAAWNSLQLNNASGSGYVGSANCTATQPIVAVVNELGNTSTADLLFTYEAVNK